MMTNIILALQISAGYIIGLLLSGYLCSGPSAEFVILSTLYFFVGGFFVGLEMQDPPRSGGPFWRLLRVWLILVAWFPILIINYVRGRP